MPRDKSTTVRSVGAGALRLGLAVGGAIAPALAARAAERMFLTPPRHPPPPREGELLAGAEPFAVRAGAEILRCWRFGEGPPVLLVHGWGGRGGQMAPLAPALQAAGRAAVAFDGPAHGASSGHTASVPAFADAVAAVAAHVGARAAVGHSMGAAGLALAMIRGLDLDAAAFLAPPRSPAAFLARFFDALRLSAPVREGVRARLERRLRIGVDALDLPRMAGGMEVPLLVVHDRGDGEVPWADGAAIAEAWPGARLVTTDGLGHRRIIRDPDVAAEVAAFVSRPAEARESPAAAG